MKNSYISQKYRFEKAEDRQFGSKSYYSILYISRGGCYFEAEGRTMHCGTEDMILLKPEEKGTIHFQGGKYRLEILLLQIRPQYLKELSDEETDLEKGMQFVPFQAAVIRADSEGSMLIKNIASKLTEMTEDEGRYAHFLYEKSLISMLVVLTLRTCIKADKVLRIRKRRNVLMDDIFLFIREHLTEELTLERLEKEFFVSRYHICREFKRLTGQTPHAYIVKARLDLCRTYIEQGKLIHEVYQLGGFGGYNHFFRAFKQEYGITPKQYYKSLQIGKEESAGSN